MHYTGVEFNIGQMNEIVVVFQRIKFTLAYRLHLTRIRIQIQKLMNLWKRNSLIFE